jgi:hypothetical protein
MLILESCDNEQKQGPRNLKLATASPSVGGPKPWTPNPRLGETGCGLRSAIYHLLSSKHARVVEWQTRTFEGRMPKGMRVQVPPRAFLMVNSEK